MASAKAEIVFHYPAIVERVRAHRCAVIEASAGTGKTDTIQHLIVDLLARSELTIEQILVVTFTEKAALELSARLRKLLDDVLRGAMSAASTDQGASCVLGEREQERLRAALDSFARAPISTIHSFCQRVLTEMAFESGTRFGLEVVEARRAFHGAFRAELRERLAGDGRAKELLRAWLAEREITALEELLFAAHRGRYLETRGEAGPAPGASLEQAVVDLLLPAMTERLLRSKRELGIIDYDDMLLWLWRALEGPGGPSLTALLRDRFRCALVDEFQDTDDLQWRILRRLFAERGAGGRLYAVGDPKQAIYGFRGADIFTYWKAREELSAGAQGERLSKNFRSTAELIDACNLIFDASGGFFTGRMSYDAPAECGRPGRSAAYADGSPVAPVTIMRYEPDGGGRSRAKDASVAMGRHIAATLRGILGGERRIRVGEGSGAPRWVQASDIFVLTRSREESRELGGYLREAGVPFAFYKQDGLFQTDEAYHVLDVLRAIETPHLRSRRLKAWLTPFFAVPFAELARLEDLPAAHPLNERLYEWRALAENERFTELFDRLLHESGLAERELFLADSERALTNFDHVFEILLEQALARRLSLGEVIPLLEQYIGGTISPPGKEGNVQRLESERPAVQVTTVHMSKGLEADVVVLYGGMNRARDDRMLAVYHDGLERRFAIGKEALKRVKPQLDREEQEEDQRLLYVALTRARVKLYLPFFPPGSTRRLNGYCAALNRRLESIAQRLARAENRQRAAELFEVASVRGARGPETNPDAVKAALAEWTPPAHLLAGLADPHQARLFRLRREHAPLLMRSYTSLRGWEEEQWRPSAAEDFALAREGAAGADDLPGGAEVGIFLHEAIERLDFESLGEARGFESWTRRADVRAVFADAMRRNQVRDPRWLERGPQIVFKALSAPIVGPRGEVIGPLGASRNVREMEFVYPIPEAGHPMLSRSHEGAWKMGLGYLKGFIDLVFERAGLIYFADWKSDLLASYDSEAVAEHVKRYYESQVRIYCVGVIRLLRLKSEEQYQRRFGGVVYAFMRGMESDDPTRGVYVHRPSWRELCAYEEQLTALGSP